MSYYKPQHLTPSTKPLPKKEPALYAITNIHLWYSFIYAIQNQIRSKTFRGCCSGQLRSSASKAALPVVISASASLMT